MTSDCATLLTGLGIFCGSGCMVVLDSIVSSCLRVNPLPIAVSHSQDTQKQIPWQINASSLNCFLNRCIVLRKVDKIVDLRVLELNVISAASLIKAIS